MDSRTASVRGASAVVLRAALAVGILCAGCSTLTPQIVPAAKLGPRPLAAAFTASGRVAARVTCEGSRGFSGGFSWVHRPGIDTIELLTPLGQIAARMTLTPAGATIEQSNGGTTQTANPEQFLSDNFGVSLPLGDVSSSS